MARSNMSLPHERRKATLKAQLLRSRVKIAEEKMRAQAAKAELAAMSPKKSNSGGL